MDGGKKEWKGKEKVKEGEERKGEGEGHGQEERNFLRDACFSIQLRYKFIYGSLPDHMTHSPYS